MMDKRSTVVISLLFLIGCSSTAPKLGIENGQLVPCSTKPNCVNSLATDDQHKIAPITLASSSAETKITLLKVLNNLPRVKIISSTETYIRAEFKSKILGFVDDVEFYFPSLSSEKTVIQVRSASRIGYSDLGVNRDRMEFIRDQLTTD